MLTTVIFYLTAAVLVGAAIGVITARNPVHSALFLIVAFVSSSVLWLLLEAEFLAIVLVLVYVGAVMVLFLFVVMMLDINAATLREGFIRYAPLGAIIAGILVLELVSVIWYRSDGLPVDRELVARAPGYSSTGELGRALYTEYLLPFELAAFLLLLAIVAAILLTMRRRPGLKAQDVAAQVRVRRADRIRLVSMTAETGPEAGTAADPAGQPPGDAPAGQRP
jgi:NADH-quinone oxidoreductase subunit J